MTSLIALIHELQAATNGTADLDQSVVDYLTPGKRMVGRTHHYTRSLDAKLPAEEVVRVARLKGRKIWRAWLTNDWSAEGATEILARRLACLTYQQFEQNGRAREYRCITPHRSMPPMLFGPVEELIAPKKGADRSRQNDQLIISILCDELRRKQGDPNRREDATGPVFDSSIQTIMRANAPPATSEPGRLSTRKMSEILASWCEERRPTVKNIARVVLSIQRFMDLNGDLPMNDYTKKQVRQYVREVRRIPRRIPHSLRGKPIQVVVRYGLDNPGVDLVTPQTAKSHLKDIQMLFNWAVATDQCATSPAANLKVIDHRNSSELRVAFDEADLKLIFERSPRYAGCLAANRRKIPGELIVKDAIFWFPLVGLFTGARLGELANAAVADFKTEDKILYLEIHAAGDNRHLKTQSSDRVIPIHPELLRIGFQTYLDRQRQLGHLGAFLEVHGQRRILDSTGWSQNWTRFQESVPINDRRKVFHSFRHTFKRACRDNGIGEEVHDALTGHRPYYSGRRYGKGIALATLQQATNKIRFGGLDLSHLYDAPLMEAPAEPSIISS